MVRRVAVPDRVLRMGLLDRVDYSDAHHLELPPDLAGALTPERAAWHVLGRAPGWVRGLVRLVHRRVLGLQLGPTAPDVPVPGWRLERSDPDELVYAVTGGLVTPRLVAVREDSGDGSVVVVTLMRFEHPAAHPVWFLVKPLHLAVLRWLLPRGMRLAAADLAPNAR